MMTLRRASERGHFDHGWLDTYHTFSFSSYYDPDHMAFRSLRVINDDRVAAGRGFGTHPHEDMEIITYVLEGELQHKDSMGNGSIIRPGEVQRMSAGTGVTHSEVNPSPSEAVHLLQIWILPERRGLPPSYEQREYPAAQRRGRLRLIAARDGRDGSVTIHQDASVYAGLFDGDERARFEVASQRHVWLQLARGSLRVNGVQLAAGDGVAITGERLLQLDQGADCELLVFDLA
ncbi:MAG: pirin family protein [Planctomycetota bacterium]